MANLEAAATPSASRRSVLGGLAALGGLGVASGTADALNDAQGVGGISGGLVGTPTLTNIEGSGSVITTTHGGTAYLAPRIRQGTFNVQLDAKPPATAVGTGASTTNASVSTTINVTDTVYQYRVRAIPKNWDVRNLVIKRNGATVWGPNNRAVNIAGQQIVETTVTSPTLTVSATANNQVVSGQPPQLEAEFDYYLTYDGGSQINPPAAATFFGEAVVTSLTATPQIVTQAPETAGGANLFSKVKANLKAYDGTFTSAKIREPLVNGGYDTEAGPATLADGQTLQFTGNAPPIGLTGSGHLTNVTGYQTSETVTVQGSDTNASVVFTPSNTLTGVKVHIGGGTVTAGVANLRTANSTIQAGTGPGGGTLSTTATALNTNAASFTTNTPVTLSAVVDGVFTNGTTYSGTVTAYALYSGARLAFSGTWYNT